MEEGEPSGAYACFLMVGPALMALRRRAGLSGAQLARKAAVGKSQLSKYENGRDLPRVESLARILDALNVDPLSFFYLVHILSQESNDQRTRLEVLTMMPGRGDGGRRLVEGLLEVMGALGESL